MAKSAAELTQQCKCIWCGLPFTRIKNLMRHARGKCKVNKDPSNKDLMQQLTANKARQPNDAAASKTNAQDADDEDMVQALGEQLDAETKHIEAPVPPKVITKIEKPAPQMLTTSTGNQAPPTLSMLQSPCGSWTRSIMVPMGVIDNARAYGAVEEVASEIGNRWAWLTTVEYETRCNIIAEAYPDGPRKQALLKRFTSSLLHRVCFATCVFPCTLNGMSFKVLPSPHRAQQVTSSGKLMTLQTSVAHNGYA